MRRWTGAARAAVVGLCAIGCACAGSAVSGTPAATAAAAGPGEASGSVASSSAIAPGSRGANLASARCQGATCKCRPRGVTGAEVPPPDENHKRFEIRLAGEDGSASFESPTLGELGAGATEACFYLDVVPGTAHDVTFTARESKRGGGVGPMLTIAEYGPKGQWWYDIIDVRCAGPGGKCNRDAADEWKATFKSRKRGRLDPCGSAVITKLMWDSAGGAGDRELGVFKDFIVKFTLDVKRFPTELPPNSKECVPR